MTDQFDWHMANDEYLATALGWLNLRLARVAEPEYAATEIVGAASPTPECLDSSCRDPPLSQNATVGHIQLREGLFTGN
jgi:hypothetical protein